MLCLHRNRGRTKAMVELVLGGLPTKSQRNGERGVVQQSCHAGATVAHTIHSSILLRTLPVGPSDRASLNSTRRGYLWAAISFLAQLTRSAASSDDPGLVVTNAFTSSPNTGSGTPTTATWDATAARP